MKSVVRVIVAIAMVSIGVLHFLQPEGFVAIVPKALPAPRMLVYVSGFFEILGGAGLVVPPVQRAAAWGLVALYLAVFPANVNMAIHHLPLGGTSMPAWALWARLPFQGVLIAVAYWLSRQPATADANRGA